MILLLIFLLTSCMKTEVICEPMTKSGDTTMVKKHRPLPPQEVDTTRIPIGFQPSVEEWEEITIMGD